jgi:hypothetical protein
MLTSIVLLSETGKSSSAIIRPLQEGSMMKAEANKASQTDSIRIHRTNSSQPVPGEPVRKLCS